MKIAPSSRNEYRIQFHSKLDHSTKMTLISGIYSTVRLPALDTNSQNDEHWPHRLHILTTSGSIQPIQQDPQRKTPGEHTPLNLQASLYNCRHGLVLKSGITKVISVLKFPDTQTSYRMYRAGIATASPASGGHLRNERERV